MDEVGEDKTGSVMDTLMQREQERKEKLRILKEEKELSEPDDSKKFDVTFEDHHQNILKKLQLLEEKSIEQNCLLDYFDGLHNDVKTLNEYLSSSTTFLSNYNVRKGIKTIENIENKCKELEDVLLPKKQFAFKKKAKSNKKKIINDKVSVDIVDAAIKNKFSYYTISCGFSNEKDKILKLDSEKIAKNSVELSNLENCTIFLFGNPSTVQINNVSRCKILCGPVTTSVMVDSCKDCDLALACQQLRIHSTQDSRFYIHVTSKAIIEDSSGVKFAPYNFDYDGIDEHFKTTGLDWNDNKWRQIDDFNWLVFDKPSPNWQEIPEEDRIQSWPL